MTHALKKNDNAGAGGGYGADSGDIFADFFGGGGGAMNKGGAGDGKQEEKKVEEVKLEVKDGKILN